MSLYGTMPRRRQLRQAPLPVSTLSFYPKASDPSGIIFSSLSPSHQLLPFSPTCASTFLPSPASASLFSSSASTSGSSSSSSSSYGTSGSRLTLNSFGVQDGSVRGGGGGGNGLRTLSRIDSASTLISTPSTPPVLPGHEYFVPSNLFSSPPPAPLSIKSTPPALPLRNSCSSSSSSYSSASSSSSRISSFTRLTSSSAALQTRPLPLPSIQSLSSLNSDPLTDSYSSSHHHHHPHHHSDYACIQPTSVKSTISQPAIPKIFVEADGVGSEPKNAPNFYGADEEDKESDEDDENRDGQEYSTIGKGKSFQPTPGLLTTNPGEKLVSDKPGTGSGTTSRFSVQRLSMRVKRLYNRKSSNSNSANSSEITMQDNRQVIEMEQRARWRKWAVHARLRQMLKRDIPNTTSGLASPQPISNDSSHLTPVKSVLSLLRSLTMLKPAVTSVSGADSANGIASLDANSDRLGALLNHPQQHLQRTSTLPGFKKRPLSMTYDINRIADNDKSHMVAAFEQSLSTMTSRLQELSSSSDLKDCELDRLRRTIEALKQHGGALVQGVNSNQQYQRSASLTGPTKSMTNNANQSNNSVYNPNYHQFVATNYATNSPVTTHLTNLPAHLLIPNSRNLAQQQLAQQQLAQHQTGNATSPLPTQTYTNATPPSSNSGTGSGRGMGNYEVIHSLPGTPLKSRSLARNILTTGSGTLSSRFSASSNSLTNFDDKLSTLSQRQPSNESVNSISSDKGKKGSKSKFKSLTSQNASWIRSSFSKVLHKKQKSPKTENGEVLSDSEDCPNPTSGSVPGSPLPSVKSFKTATSGSDAASGSRVPLPESVDELQKALRDKDMALTDMRLESLTSAHQLESVKETLTQMRLEMVSLKQDNERLQRLAKHKSLHGSSSSLIQSISSQQVKPEVDNNDPEEEYDSDEPVILTLEGSLERGSAVRPVTLGSGTHTLATFGLHTKTSWIELDRIVQRLFRDHLMRVDKHLCLGITVDSLACYRVGAEQLQRDLLLTSQKATPELLPFAYLIEESHINLQFKGTLESLTFDTLTPKSILANYIDTLNRERRLLLGGVSGTGKTFLAHKLAEYLVIQDKLNGNELYLQSISGAIATFAIDHKNTKELCNYLAQLLSDPETLTPMVIILDNLHHIDDLLLAKIHHDLERLQRERSVFVIGTLNSESVNLVFEEYSLMPFTVEQEPVKGFLERFLIRKWLQNESKSGRAPIVQRNSRVLDRKPMSKVIRWLPRVWRFLNRYLVKYGLNSGHSIGPRLFTSCPMDYNGAQIWFADLWNFSILPFITESLRESLTKAETSIAVQQQLFSRLKDDDPTEWIIASYPWNVPGTDRAEWTDHLNRLKIEDILERDSVDVTMSHQAQNQQRTKPPSGQNEKNNDIFMQTLMKLQEASDS